MSDHCSKHKKFSRMCSECMRLRGIPTPIPTAKKEREDLALRAKIGIKRVPFFDEIDQLQKSLTRGVTLSRELAAWMCRTRAAKVTPDQEKYAKEYLKPYNELRDRGER